MNHCVKINRSPTQPTLFSPAIEEAAALGGKESMARQHQRRQVPSPRPSSGEIRETMFFFFSYPMPFCDGQVSSPHSIDLCCLCWRRDRDINGGTRTDSSRWMHKRPRTNADHRQRGAHLFHCFFLKKNYYYGMQFVTGYATYIDRRISMRASVVYLKILSWERISFFSHT